MNLASALCEQKIVAILRGVTPKRIHSVCQALIEVGVHIVEVPLNSPDALNSIEQIADHYSDKLIFGAGTVLSTKQVDDVSLAGGQLIVSPNTNPDVIDQALKKGLMPMPGIATPSEAFSALECGATHLKVFPANALGYEFVKAIKAVLPSAAHLFAVGQIDMHNITRWLAAGCTGVGIGSQLYNSNDTDDQWREKCRHLNTFLTSNKPWHHAKL